MSVSLRKYITNVETVDLLDWSQLTPTQRASTGVDSNFDDAAAGNYFVYRGDAYSLDDFTRIGDPESHERLSGFDGALGTSAFTAVLVDISPVALDDAVRVAYWSE